MITDEFLINRKIQRLGSRLVNKRTEDLKFFDLTPEQSDTLQFFAANPGAKLIDLKNHFDVSHQAARSMVERMKKKDLLYVEISAEDARAKEVYLTAKGRKTCEELQAMGCGVGDSLLTGIDKEERQWLLTALDKMIENVENF